MVSESKVEIAKAVELVSLAHGLSSADFQLLFEASPHPYLILKPDPPVFTIVAASNSYLAASGTQRSDILGQGLFQVFPDNPNDPTATGVSDLRSSLNRVIQNQVPDTMGVQKYDIPQPNSQEFEVRYWSPVNTPVFDATGSLAFIIHQVEDITEFILFREAASKETVRIEEAQARAGQMEAEVIRSAREVKEANRRLKAANEVLAERERELAKLNDRLTELDRVKTEFFSNISHEFRTPLALMLGPLEEALPEIGKTDPAIQRERLETVHRNALRLLKLVNNLLDFSRIEAGRVQALYQPTDLSAFTKELVSMFRSAVDRVGLKLVVNCPPLAEPVYVDGEMWEKIVLNLLSNAFKYTFSGEIEVRLRRINTQIELTVRDTGVGIPPDQLPFIFKRFHRVPHTRSRTFEGSGIGLSLVQELVKLHGGDIQVESVVDQGSTFTVTIPAGKAHLPNDQIEAGPSLSPTVLGAQPFVEEVLRWLPTEPPSPSLENNAETAWCKTADDTRVRVLLADDNADMRDYVCRLLTPHCEVETVSDGEAAFLAIRRNPPDLVLSDIMMPKMNGFQLLSVLRQDPALRTIPVILLSARAGEEARVEGLQAGANDYLVKPFNAGELLARVKANLNLELHRARREAEAALVETERWLSNIFNQTSVGIAQTDLTGQFVLVNERYCEIVGRSKEELYGLRMQEITHPDDLAKNTALFNQVIQTGNAFKIEKRYIRPDSSTVWVHNNVSLIQDADQKPRFIVAVSQDITEQKLAEEALQESEAKFRRLAESNIIGIAFWDVYGNVNEANDAFLNMLGYTRAEMQAGKLKWMETSRLEDQDLHAAGIQRAIAGETVVPYETQYIHREGHPIDAIVGYTMLEGSQEHGIAFVLDISERKQTERELLHLKEALEQRVLERTVQLETTNKELEAFSYSVSHDLRAPLRAIDGFSQAMIEDYADQLDETGKRYLTRIREGSQNMAQLIEDMLKLSRLTRGALSIIDGVDLSWMAKEVAQELQQQEPERQVSIQIEEGLVGRGDPHLLHVVLQNLLGNAWKYTSNHATAHITFGMMPGNPSIYYVKDDGAGFDMAYAGKLFGAFQRLHDTREFPGTGIGLATVARIIHRHQGEVWAEGAVEKGAAFYFTLEPISLKEKPHDPLPPSYFAG